MKSLAAAIGCCILVSADAQVPHIVGSWRLDPVRSEYPGPAPEIDIRQYRLTNDGWLVGLAVSVTNGSVNFLQFTAKADGKDYPEYSAATLEALQKAGEPTPFAYSEKPKDSHTVEWADKFNGQVYVSGTRNVSEDGRTMTIVATRLDRDGKQDTFTLVYDRYESED